MREQLLPVNCLHTVMSIITYSQLGVLWLVGSMLLGGVWVSETWVLEWWWRKAYGLQGEARERDKGEEEG